MSELTSKEQLVLSKFEEGIERKELVARVVDANEEMTERSASPIITSLVKKEILTADDGILGITDKGTELLGELLNIDEDVDAGAEDDDDILFAEEDAPEEDDEPEPVTMVQKAAKRAKDKADLTKAAKADAKKGPKVARFDHANCGHATQGAEGKKARAACRREHAKAAEAETAEADA